MITEKRFPDNHTLIGATALAYNIQMADLYQEDTSKPYVKNTFANKITDLGFEWKKSSDANWTRISLKNNQNEYFYSCDGDVFTLGRYVYYGRSDDFARTYMQESQKIISGRTYELQQYSVKGEGGKYKRHPKQAFPLRVIIPDLEVNTTYNIRSYYNHITNGMVYYNEQTVKTLENKRTVTFTNFALTSNANTALQNGQLKQTTVDKFINLTNGIIEKVKKFYERFYFIRDRSISLKLDYNASSGAGATGTTSGVLTFNLYYTIFSTNEKYTRSTFVHELGHCLTNKNAKRDGTQDPNITKFMEFMSNAPYANWKWTGNHAYPSISSEYFSPMDDELNFFAYTLMD